LIQLLYRLLDVYFSHKPRPYLDRAYRQVLVVGIRAYRLLIRPFINNECQFSVTCSQLTLDLISSRVSFDKVRQQCLQRYCECRLPFDSVRVGNRLLFISSQGRQLDEQEVSERLRASADN